jgi:hypothetical protein
VVDVAVQSPEVVRTEGPSPAGWGGAAVLVVPTAGVFVTVAAIVIVNEVNHWWVLLLAMGIVVVATFCVIATIMRMLSGDDS